MKLYDSTEKMIDQTKNRERLPSLEVIEVVLVQCNLVDNQCQQKSEALYTFMLNKPHAYFLSVKPSNLVFLQNL